MCMYYGLYFRRYKRWQQMREDQRRRAMSDHRLMWQYGHDWHWVVQLVDFSHQQRLIIAPCYNMAVPLIPRSSYRIGHKSAYFYIQLSNEEAAGHFIFSYMLSREYRVVRNRYSRLLFTCEDRLRAYKNNRWIWRHNASTSRSLVTD